MLFDTRLSNFGAQLLDISRDGDGLDVLQPEVVAIAPIEEAFYRARVRHPGIAVADGRGKEFDKAAAGAFALDADNRRQRLQPSADQRQRRYYLVGQQDRLLRHGLLALPGLPLDI